MLTAALGIACELASDLSAIANLKALRNRLWVGLQKNLGDRVVLNGHPEKRLPNTLNVSFIGQVGAAILEKIPEIAASTGSACHAGRVELSPVLKAMGVSEDTGAGAIRFSLGRTTTAIEIDAVVERLIDILEHSN
jgi:cysteine desulfurase